MTSATEWDYDAHGHAWRRVSVRDVEKARLEREALDSASAEIGPQLFHVTQDTRWIGRLGENEAADWLRAHGCTVEQHGGVDQLPDLVVDGTGVAVKTVRTRGRFWAPDALVPIADRYARKPNGSYLLFCACDPHGPDVAILGVISHRAFMHRATFHDVGSSPRPGLTITYPSWWLPAGALVSAHAWAAEKEA